MIHAFTSACLLGVALADFKNVEWVLADDKGYISENVVSDLEDGRAKFMEEWGVDHRLGVNRDSEDDEGYEIENTYFIGGARLEIMRDQIVDMSVFQGATAVYFDVNVVGQKPTYEDTYEAVLTVTYEDGEQVADSESGSTSE